VFYTNERDHYGSYLQGLYGATGAPLAAPILTSIHSTLILVSRNGRHSRCNLSLYRTSRGNRGARYSHNNQYFDVTRSGLLGSTQIPPGSSSDSANTYLFTGSFHPDSTSTLYIRAASAYNPDPRRSWRTRPFRRYTSRAPFGIMRSDTRVLLDGSCTAEASAYHIKWSQIQLNSIINGFNRNIETRRRKIDGSMSQSNVSAFEITVKPLMIRVELNL